MIWTVFQINVRRLLHNRVELLLTFFVPIAFFSIFAIIFGGGVGSGSVPKIKVVLVDQADDEVSRNVAERLRESPGLRFMTSSDSSPLTVAQARHWVRRGGATLAIVIRHQTDEPRTPSGLSSTSETSHPTLSAELLADASDQVASQVVSAVVAQALARVEAGRKARIAAGVRHRLSSFQSRRPSESIGQGQVESTPIEPESSQQASLTEAIRVVDVMGEGKSNPVISMYAAGIAVMFLLFGATGGGGALLEEKESQTLDRLLSTRMTMDQLLLGKWFYMTTLGVVQVSVMFLWGQLVFDVDLMGHLDGFLTMTVVTALASSAFGLFLATLCRTRGQLNGLSVVLVLTMSALGGSMVPRYVMSERLQQVGLWTFNAWSLDGYNKVFWREMPISSLAPQLSVLLLCGVVFLLAARILAVRWETD